MVSSSTARRLDGGMSGIGEPGIVASAGGPCKSNPLQAARVRSPLLLHATVTNRRVLDVPAGAPAGRNGWDDVWLPRHMRCLLVPGSTGEQMTTRQSLS